MASGGKMTNIGSLEAILDAAVGKGLVGCALGIRRGGHEVANLASGHADREAAIPLNPDAQFRIASITKTFVAALVLQLVEEGRFSLDDVLARWLPERPFADRVTLRQILNQTGGLPVYSVYKPDDYPPADADLPRTVYIDHAYERTPAKPPGGPFEYANVGSRVLGHIIELETGEELTRLMETRLIEPLGLADTLASGWRGPPPPRLARGYAHEGSVVRDVTHRVPPNHLWSGGDMISTVSDLTRWTRALFKGEVVGPALTEALRTELVPGVFHDSSMSHHGLGVMVFSHGGRRLFGHRGSTPGFVGIVGYDPGEDLAVAVQTNSFASDSASVFRAEVETILFEAARAAGSAAVKPGAD